MIFVQHSIKLYLVKIQKKRCIPPLGGARSRRGANAARSATSVFVAGFSKLFAVNSRGLFDDQREEFRRPAKSEEKSVKRKLRCTRRYGPRQRALPWAKGTAMDKGHRPRQRDTLQVVDEVVVD